ncbi:MAG TPA: ABC transporter substrate-binding protein, partial [Trebonia sp.]|nr:ABC transporter substrate-binding protein [Trebonia sp.]
MHRFAVKAGKNRRRLAIPGIAVCLLLVTTLLAACGGASTSNASSSSAVALNAENTAAPGQELNVAGDPENGGTLHIAMSADPLCLDPHQISSDVEQLLGNIQFDNLTFLGKNGLPQPWLATSWKITNGGKTYTFQLKQGVTFSDGAPFNAAAVVANFEQMLNPATRSALAGPYIEPYKSSKILGTYTLQVNLSYAYSPFLYVLAQGWLGMESPKALAADTPAQLCAHPVGSGPFVMTNYTKNVGVTYVRRADYNWGPPELGQSGAAHLAGIDLSWIGQDPVRYDGLVSGQYQLTQYVPAQDAAALKANKNFIYEDIDRTGWPFTFDFNTSRGPLASADVRKAIVEGVNVNAIVQTATFGQQAAATSYLDPVTKYYDAGAKLPGYNLPAAVNLLDAAGWSKTDAAGYRENSSGKELDLTLPVSNASTISPVYDLLQAQLKASLGINLILKVEPLAQYQTDRYDGNYDLLAGVWHTNTPDVLYIKYDSSQIPGPTHLGQNLAHLDDPALDTILQQARQTTDQAQLTKLYAQAQTRLT